MKKIFKAIINAALACFVPRRGGSMPEHPARIGVVMCHWLGDTFWAYQTIPCLKKRFPDADIHLFLRLDFSDLFYNLVAPENIHITPEVISDRKRERFSWLKLTAAARRYRPLNFGLMIDLTGNRYSALFTRLLKPEYSIGFEGDEFGSLYSMRMPVDAHKRKRLLTIIQGIGGMEQAAEFPCHPATPLAFKEVCKRIPLPESVSMALLAPKAGWAEKEWGIDNFSALAAALSAEGHHIVVLGMPGNKEECGRIIKSAGTGRATFFSGTLKEVFALMTEAAIFVGGDSGLGHIAASFEHCRTIMIFKATEPAELLPLGGNSFVLDGRNKTITVNDVLSCCRTK